MKYPITSPIEAPNPKPKTPKIVLTIPISNTLVRQEKLKKNEAWCGALKFPFQEKADKILINKDSIFKNHDPKTLSYNATSRKKESIAEN